MASLFLLDISRDMRLRGYSLQTEKTYLSIPAEFLGTNSLNSPIQLLEPHVFYTLVVLRAALLGVQTVEVAKRHVFYRFRPFGYSLCPIPSHPEKRSRVFGRSCLIHCREVP